MLLAVGVLIVAGAYLVARSQAASGVLSLSPATQTVGVGNTFTVTVHENSGSDAVNAVEADLVYSASTLQFVSIDTSTSAFGVEAVNTGGSGTVKLARGTQTAVTGDQIVAVVTFKALTTTTGSSASVTFGASSAIVKASDQSNVLVSTTGGNYAIADQTAPTVPSGLTVGTRTMNSIQISWTASTDNIGVTTYKVYRNGTQVASTQNTPYVDSGLVPGTSYSYTVAAVDAAGNTSAQSTAVQTSTLPDAQAPTVPGTPTSSAQTMSSITLSWGAATDNVAVTGYKLYRNGNLLTSVTGTTYSDQGLTANTSYTYAVAAFDAAGNNSAQSAGAVIKTLADTQAPTKPGSLSYTQTRQSVTLNYAAATDNVGVTGYLIYRDGTNIATTAALSYVDQTVATGSHNYAVAAIDGAGNLSAQATITAVVYPVSDINRDGAVNIFDLSTMLSNWGKTGNNASDLNGDGVVNVFDLSSLLTAWTG